MNTTVDGEFQRYAVEDGAYIREHFFGPDPRLRKMVEHLSDDELRSLPRGGHDYRKLYAAYKAADGEPGGPPDGHPGQDGQGLDARPRGRGPQRHPPDQEDDQGAAAGAARPPVPPRRDPRGGAGDEDEPAVLPAGRGLDRVPVHDGAAPGARRLAAAAHHDGAAAPRAARPTRPFAEFDGGSGGQAVSTTMAFARLLRNLCRDEHVRAAGRADHPRRGPHVRHGRAVPRVQDLRLAGPAVRAGRRRAAAVLHRVRRTARSSRRASPRPARWPASPPPAPSTPPAACPMVPFFIFYSMFGFQRVGDLIWAVGRRPRPRASCSAPPPGARRCSARASSTRTATACVLASTVPAVPGLRPGVRLRDRRRSSRHGIHRMYGGGPRRGDRRLLLPHALQRELRDAGDAGHAGARRGDRRGALPLGRGAAKGRRRRRRSCSPASAQAAARAAAAELAEHYDVAAELWSATSYKALREEALSAERWNRLHPAEEPRAPRVTELLDRRAGRSSPSPTS